MSNEEGELRSTAREADTVHPMGTEGEAFEGALFELAALRATMAHLSAYLVEVVATARREGRSWTEIGNALGVSKQAVVQRYGPNGVYDVEKMNSERN